ncbi:MAG: PAS domain S-box protein, partial [Promethearchaeota archaeon]
RSAGTIQDVTADKIMMEALDRSEERYRRLVDESLQGIAIIVDERIVFANPAYAETVGREVRDLLRMTADEVWSMVHPDDVAELKKRSRELNAGAFSLPRHRFRYVRPNGEVRWVESYVNVVEHDGEAALQTVEIDITEQQAAEDALRESEKRFKDIFQASPIGILLFDSEGRIVQFNRTAGQILGVSSNSDFEDYRLYDDPNVPSWVWDNVQEEADASFEVSYSPKKARIRSTREGEAYVHITGSAVQVLEDGTVTTYLVHMRDIADTKRAEFALRESEEKYRNLVESSSLPFIILQGSPPVIVYSNPAASKVSGYGADELRSMGPEWTTRLIEPRSLSGSLETLRDIQTGALEANPQGYEDRYLHKDGSILWLRAHPTKTTYNGSPALQVHFIDLTEQRALERALSESEEEYRQLLETSDDSVLLLKEGYVFDCNKASLKIFGCKKGEIIDKAFWQLSTRSQPDKSISKGKTQEYLEQVLRTGAQLHRWRFKKCNGRSFEAETTWRPIEFKKDTIIQVQLRPIKKL